MSLRIVFAGTPEFAVPSLQALVDAGHQVVAVYCQPDRPKGRGRKLLLSPVKQLALKLGLPVRQPEKFAGDVQLQLIAEDQADILVVVAYGQILPEVVLNKPRFGSVNVHASLLPRWRGAAPIHRAIINGDEQTGITVMQMDAGLDTGPMLLQESCVIGLNETTGQLHDRLAKLGAECLVKSVSQIEGGRVEATPQPEMGMTYAKKVEKSEARIVWDNPALAINRQIRGLNPVPMAYSFLSGERIKIVGSQLSDVPVDAAPGEVVKVDPSGLSVATGDGVLVLTQLQPAGSKSMAVRDFLNSRQLVVGQCFGED